MESLAFAEQGQELSAQSEYDLDLLRRFKFWREQSGSSDAVVARKLKRGSGVVRAYYMHKSLRGKALKEFEADISYLLSKEANVEDRFRRSPL
jgi:ribosomal protein L16/L10AE